MSEETQALQAQNEREGITATLGSREYLHAEINRLRELWGTKAFWQDVDKASRAISGLLYVWMRTNDYTESDTVLMNATCMEFDRRLLFAMAHV